MSTFAGDDLLYAEQCFASLSSQTLLPSEVVLVIDGPIPARLLALISDWATSAPFPVTTVSLPENRGLGHALNTGVIAAKSNWICRMDPDDIMLPDRIRTQHDFIVHNDIDIFGSFAVDIDDRGSVLGLHTVPVSHQEIVSAVWASPLIHPTVMFRRQSILDVGLYSTRNDRAEDYELWFRCVERGLRFANIPEALIRYRRGSQFLVRNNFRVSVFRARVGLAGCRRLRLPWFTYLGVLWPVARDVLPGPLRMSCERVVRSFDPRIVNSGRRRRGLGS